MDYNSSSAPTPEKNLRRLIWSLIGHKGEPVPDELNRPIYMQPLPGYNGGQLLVVEGSPPHGTILYFPDLPHSLFWFGGRGRSLKYDTHLKVRAYVEQRLAAERRAGVKP